MLSAGSARAATALFLSEEFQAQDGANAGTIRGGDPAGAGAFAAFLGTAGLISSDVASTLSAPGNYAVWSNISDPGAVASTSISFSGTSVGVSVSGWGSSGLTTPSGNAVIDGFGLSGTSLQSASPRPGFASGAGSGVYIGTSQGGTSDGIRNAVTFNLSSFAGGGVYAFGIFGGDLETGGPGGSPSGFLFVQFANGDTETIKYDPDASLFPDAAFTGTNNAGETYGNETSRFVGISDDTRLITAVTFVVGDDDDGDNGDSEQLSFIAPMVFMSFDGTTAVPLVPMNVPEPSAAVLMLAGLAAASRRRRRA